MKEESVTAVTFDFVFFNYLAELQVFFSFSGKFDIKIVLKRKLSTV